MKENDISLEYILFVTKLFVVPLSKSFYKALMVAVLPRMSFRDPYMFCTLYNHTHSRHSLATNYVRGTVFVVV